MFQALPMNVRLTLALPGLLAGATLAWADTGGREQNLWPVTVRYSEPAAAATHWSAAGPFLFHDSAIDADGRQVRGFRPFWVQIDDARGRFQAGYFLYPVFSYTLHEDSYKWSVFELVRRWDRRADAGAPASDLDRREQFEVFPLWFSRETADPETSYRALFPIFGTIRHRLGFERLSWTLFPFYVENESRGAVTTSTPWPFIRVTRGAAHGWGVWPLFNYVERPGVSRSETYLWPLGYNLTRQPSPDDPPGTPPRRDVGALPFYARSSGPGYLSEDFFWPFFGYTEQTAPQRYRERRYLWPFFVQGLGDQRVVNRWAPFYTHSHSKGYDKQWFVWPLLRYAAWTEEGVERRRTQLLFFVYWNEQQRRLRGSSAGAELTHVWPLFSHWDNGAGRRQWQFPSPLDVFFTDNEKVRLAWSPLFALARHDQRAPGAQRTALLWNAITWETDAAAARSEFHLGPLLGVTRQAEERRIAIGHGLFGFRRTRTAGWRMFWLDFPAKPASNPPASR